MSRSNQTRSSGLGFSYKVNSLSNAYQVLQTKVLRVKDSTRDIPKEKRSSLRAVQLKASFPTKREENEQTLPEKEKKKTKKRVPKTHKKGKGERNPLKHHHHQQFPNQQSKQPITQPTFKEQTKKANLSSSPAQSSQTSNLKFPFFLPSSPYSFFPFSFFSPILPPQPQPNTLPTHPQTLVHNPGHSLRFRIAASTACHSTRSSSAFLPGAMFLIEVGRLEAEDMAGPVGG